MRKIRSGRSNSPPTFAKSLSLKAKDSKKQKYVDMKKKEKNGMFTDSDKKKVDKKRHDEFKKKHGWKEHGCPVKERDIHQMHIKVEKMKDSRFHEDDDHELYLLHHQHHHSKKPEIVGIILVSLLMSLLFYAFTSTSTH